MRCGHKPRCPSQTTMWRCGQRSRIEQAIQEGRLTELEGTRLLQHYGLPRSPVSKVFTGQRPSVEKNKLW